MRKRIIGVTPDAAMLRFNAEALETAGHEVCCAHNILELKKYLDNGKCDIIIIGPTVPSKEKLRIANFARQYAGNCEIVELYESSPELEMASTQVRCDAGCEGLVEAIAQMARIPRLVHA